MTASAGGIDITAAGAADKDLDLTCTNGSVNITAGENIADAIVISAGAAAGMDFDCGTGDIDFCTSADARTTNFLTGAAVQTLNIAGNVADVITMGNGTAGTAASTTMLVLVVLA